VARRATKTRPDPPDLAPRRDPAPDGLESGALWDGVDAGADVGVPEHVAGVRLRESRWVGADLSGRRLSGFECRDTEFVHCNLSGTVLEDALLTRVAFTGCRLTGVVLSGATLRDVRIVDGRADLALLRMANAKHLWIEDTSLRGADLYAFDGSGCAFLGCDLTDAALGDAHLPGVLLHGSTVDAVRGAAALRGARIAADQVVPLGAAVLAALDITVSPPP
jgi:pentapeptide repeat protein